MNSMIGMNRRRTVLAYLMTLSLLFSLLLLTSCDNARPYRKFVGSWKAVRLNEREVKSFFNLALPLTRLAVKGYLEKPLRVSDATYEMNLKEDGTFEILNDVSLWVRPDLISVGSKTINSDDFGYSIRAKGKWSAMPNHILFSPKEASFNFKPEEASGALEMLIDKRTLNPPLVGQACLFRFKKGGNLVLLDNAGMFLEFVKK